MKSMESVSAGGFEGCGAVSDLLVKLDCSSSGQAGLLIIWVYEESKRIQS